MTSRPAERFRSRRLLRSSGGVDTYLASERGGEVVVRAWQSPEAPGLRERLAREARLLADTQELKAAVPQVVSARGEPLVMVRPFVPGVSLTERLAQGPLPIPDTLALGRALLAALARAHVHGLRHLHVHPSNVIFTGDRQARVVLVDFGCGREGAWADEAPLEAAGIPSPEQAGLVDAEIDARTDLFGVGVVLHACLAGRLPFTGATLGELLRSIMVASPELRAGRPEVPAALEELVRRLLQVDPRHRYATAAGAGADLDEIERSLAAGQAEPVLVPGRRDRRTTLAPPALVGRAGELAALDAALGAARAGEGGLVLVEGASGGGKTMLLEACVRRARAAGFQVFSGRAEDRAPRTPFAELDGIVEAVRAQGPKSAELLRQRLGEHAAALVRLFPSLVDVLGGAQAAAPAPEEFAQTRAVASLAAFLHDLGGPERPALVVLDDLQWSSEQLFQVVSAFSAADGAPRHVLLLAACRAGEGARFAALTRTHLTLSPLDREGVSALAESMAGPLPPQALELVERAGGGNPFLTRAVVEGLVEVGALTPGTGGWTLDLTAADGAQFSQHAAELLAYRLQQLPPETHRLLAAGALLGRRFALDRAAALAGQSPDQAALHLADARRRHFLWDDGRRWVFVHDRLREELLTGLGEQQVRALHEAAALALESEERANAYELAYHFDAAGQADRALPYALTAGADARARCAFETAEAYYRIASRGVAATNRTVRLQIALALGDVLVVRSNYTEATLCLVEAVELTPDGRVRADVFAKLSYAALRASDARACRMFAEEGLRLLGHRPPRSRPALVAGLFWQALVQVAHSTFPRFFLGRRPAARARDDKLAMVLYNRLSTAYLIFQGALGAIWAHLCELNLAEGHAESVELGMSCALHGVAMSQVPLPGRAQAYSDRAIEILRRQGDPWKLGIALSQRAVTLITATRYEEALACATESSRLLHRMGDTAESAGADYYVALSRYRMGRLAEAARGAQAVWEAERLSANPTAVGCLDCWAFASHGRIAEISDETIAPFAGKQVDWAILMARGVRALGHGSPAEAARLLEQAAQDVEQHGLRNEWAAPVRGWLATALREEALAVPPEDPVRREGLLRRAERAATKAVQLGRSFQSNLPHALREAGRVALLRGKHARARRLLDESLRVAAAQGARFEHAQTRLVLGQAGRALGWVGAEQDLADARLALAALEPVAPAPSLPSLSLIDRFSVVLEVGRRLASAGTRASVFDAVREAARSLLRADDAGVVEVSGGQVLGTPPAELEELARRALSEGRAVVEEGASGLGGARPTICVPLYVHGHVEACVYATGTVAGQFQGDGERLARFVATLAGAALENAEGLAARARAEQQIRGLTEAALRGQEEERKRLAMALHDGAGQVLIAVVFQLAELISSIAEDRREKAREIQSLVRDVLEDLRGLAHDLMPVTLQRLGLTVALRGLAKSTTTGSLEVVLDAEEETYTLSPETTVALFRIAQAAVANVVRHAGARRVTIQVSTDADQLTMEIADDGAGFDPDGVGGRSIGLVGMRERATWARGTFLLDTAPGRGTRITVTVPLA